VDKGEKRNAFRNHPKMAAVSPVYIYDAEDYTRGIGRAAAAVFFQRGRFLHFLHYEKLYTQNVNENSKKR
jgi:hypothetical protein